MGLLVFSNNCSYCEPCPRIPWVCAWRNWHFHPGPRCLSQYPHGVQVMWVQEGGRGPPAIPPSWPSKPGGDRKAAIRRIGKHLVALSARRQGDGWMALTPPPPATVFHPPFSNRVGLYVLGLWESLRPPAVFTATIWFSPHPPTSSWILDPCFWTGLLNWMEFKSVQLGDSIFFFLPLCLRFCHTYNNRLN